jgi:Flp pilus assembly secretin CpaC
MMDGQSLNMVDPIRCWQTASAGIWPANFLPRPIRLWSGVLLIALLIHSVGLAEAQQIDVVQGQLSHIELDAPAHTVAVGDETIADATVAFGDAVLLFGRELGITNLIIFDSSGNQVYSATVNVVPAFTRGPVQILAAGIRIFIDCTPVRCEDRRLPDQIIESTTTTQSEDGRTQIQSTITGVRN